MLRQWESKKRCSKRELQSLVESLQFASKCIPSSRLFTGRLLRALPRSATTSRLVETIPAQLERTCVIPGAELDPGQHSPSVHRRFCDSGCRRVFRRRMVQLALARTDPSDTAANRIPGNAPNPPLLNCLGRRFREKRIIFHCDNEGPRSSRLISRWDPRSHAQDDRRSCPGQLYADPEAHPWDGQRNR